MLTSIKPGETRSEAVTLLRRYIDRRPANGGVLHVAYEVGADGTVYRATSRWTGLPEYGEAPPWPVWDEIV